MPNQSIPIQSEDDRHKLSTLLLGVLLKQLGGVVMVNINEACKSPLLPLQFEDGPNDGDVIISFMEAQD